MPTSNRNTRGSWHGRGRGSRGHGSKGAVYEAETTDTSKPIVDATNSDVDIVRLLQAYGMVPTEGSELKHRRKKVATDEITVIQTLAFGDDFIFEPIPLVLHGSPLECNIDVQWESSEDTVPINSYITNHTTSKEVANPLDWSFDVHLIEINDIHTDVIYSNMELNGIVLKAKQDTRSQINMLSKMAFQTLQKDCKLPFYPKTYVKLVGYGNKVINYWVQPRSNVTTMVLRWKPSFTALMSLIPR